MRTWKDVPGLEDRYEVSNDGLVRTKPQILKATPTKKGGHLQINLGLRRRAYVHRLVAEAFIPNPEGKPVVNHKNGDPKDNGVDNLEWATYGENIAHGYRENGRVHYSNIPVDAYVDGERVATYPSMEAAAKAVGVTRGAIRSALVRGGKCRGVEWRKAR